MQPTAFSFGVEAPKAMLLTCVLQLLLLSFTKFLIFTGRRQNSGGGLSVSASGECICISSQCIAAKWGYTHANEVLNSA